jgi:chemotaxis protein CheD
MDNIIDVSTGKVKTGKGLLSVGALGSCVAVLAYGPKNKIGAIAHVMLPGKAPDKEKTNKTKYAIDAVDELIRKMSKLGPDEDNIRIYLIGGANVLDRIYDTVSRDNISSVLEALNNRNLKVHGEALGGKQRRSVLFDVKNGIIRYTEGDGLEKYFRGESND